MAVFKLRGQSYPITNIGTLGNKIQTCTKNAFASPADDAIAAYCVSRACPSIPPEIASWNSQSDFIFTLDEYEFAIFTMCLFTGALEKRLEETKDSSQRAIINQSINSLKQKLGNVEYEMSQAIANELSKEFQRNNSTLAVEVKPQIESQAIAVIPSQESAITEEEQRWLDERRAARQGAKIVEAIIQ